MRLCIRSNNNMLFLGGESCDILSLFDMSNSYENGERAISHLNLFLFFFGLLKFIQVSYVGIESI